MQKSYCMICGKEKNGIEIEEDNVIRVMRRLKEMMGKKPNVNRIVVCSACYPEYKKHRKKFISRERIYIALGVIFLLLGLVVSGRLSSIIVGLAVLLLMYLLSLLNYTPALKLGKGMQQGPPTKRMPEGAARKRGMKQHKQ